MLKYIQSISIFLIMQSAIFANELSPNVILEKAIKRIDGIDHMEGQYFVQLLDCGGLGQCHTEEEIEVLYKTLCRKSIYQL